MAIDREKLYPWLTILRAKHMGSGRAIALEKHFGSIEKTLQASPSEIAEISRFSVDIGKSVQEAANGKYDREVEKELKWAEKQGVSILLYSDKDFPFMLRHIPSPPALLYVKGSIQPEDIISLAIVGSRGASDGARRLAGQIACDLADAGLTIISGLAWGVDASAHKGALRSKTGRTFAVMGNGLGMVYPKEHGLLADQIIKRGALITELFHDVTPQGRNFPTRNRIISGLSLGVLIVEAAEKSGSLITADYALDQGKEVFALSGSAESNSSPGTVKLIQNDGAKLIQSAQDILDVLQDRITYYRNDLQGIIPKIEMPNPEYHLQDTKEAQTPPQPSSDPMLEKKPVSTTIQLSDDEKFLAGHLSVEPKHIDELSREVGWNISKVSSVLGLLEFKDVIERQGGMRFRLKE